MGRAPPGCPAEQRSAFVCTTGEDASPPFILALLKRQPSGICHCNFRFIVRLCAQFWQGAGPADT